MLLKDEMRSHDELLYIFIVIVNTVFWDWSEETKQEDKNSSKNCSLQNF